VYLVPEFNISDIDCVGKAQEATTDKVGAVQLNQDIRYGIYARILLLSSLVPGSGKSGEAVGKN